MHRLVERVSDKYDVSSYEAGDRGAIVSILAFVLQEAVKESAMHQGEE